ncbi:MAG: histidine phosphatase family protein [Chlamydiota bacterium]|jgi:probable phosphoglycerate mutase
MIPDKEFYFIRHGQTNYNKSLTKVDHADISLNLTGKKQAIQCAPLIKKLPIQTICCSPLKRAKETKELLLPKSKHTESSDLGECTAQVWKEMTSLQSHAYTQGSSSVKEFLDRIQQGLNFALKQQGPVLIVSHGGVHWGICFWLQIRNHNWTVDNCLPVHFSMNEDTWIAKLL